MPVRSRKCRPRWIISLKPAATSASPSAQKRQRWCSSQPQANSTSSHSERKYAPGSRVVPYFGRTLSRTATIDTEINNRISKASVAFGRLREKVWDRRGIRLETKLKVYRAVVLTTLLYGAETWTVYRRQEKILNHFHLRCLHSLLHIHWQDKIPNTEVLQRASLPSITTIAHNWDGQVTSPACMTTASPSSSSTENSVMANTQSEANINASMTVSKSLWKTWILISTDESWDSLASIRPCWCRIVTQGAITAEEHRTLPEPSKQSRKELHARPELLALHRIQPTTARLVGKAYSSPGLVSSATFGHTVAALLTDYAHGHLQQRRTNNIVLWD